MVDSFIMRNSSCDVNKQEVDFPDPLQKKGRGGQERYEEVETEKLIISSFMAVHPSA